MRSTLARAALVALAVALVPFMAWALGGKLTAKVVIAAMVA